MEHHVVKKTLKKWPSLEKILEESKKIKQETLTEKLLDPISNLSLSSGSNISEITDPFEEFHKDSFLNRQRDNKYLTKHEADIKTMELFTDDYKSIMNQLRHEMQLSNGPLCDDIFKELENQATLSTQDDINKSRKNAIEKNQDIKIKDYSIPVIQETLNQRVKSKDSRKSSESAIWNVLEAHTNMKLFQITPPGYNIYREGKHWLERPHIEWERINKSKLKVEKWLDKME